MDEINTISSKKYFEGIISDIGGPSANMYGLYCKLHISETCKKQSCLYPEICSQLETSQKAYTDLLQKAKKQAKIKKIFVSSGVRFDLALRDNRFSKDLVKYYTGGHLKLAPEHVNDKVLHLMYKPNKKVYDEFCKLFSSISEENGKNSIFCLI